jgi:hypothetical protein
VSRNVYEQQEEESMFDRVRDIIHVALAERGITRYRLIDLTPENWQLPGSSYYMEIEAASGIVVTPECAYHFEFGWADDHYTLGEEGRDWHELTSEDTTEYNWHRVLQIQQQMRDDPAFGWCEPLVSPRRDLGKPTEREVMIIWWWLASSRFFAACDLTDYAGPIFEAFEVFAVQSGGHDLVGSLLPGEVQDISGILVLAQGAFHFRLSWESVDDPYHRNPAYSLGEENSSWRPVLREECSEEQWQQLQMTQQRLDQVFAQLPRSEQPKWRDRADDDVRSTEPRYCLRRNPVKRRTRVLRQIS